jgi:hypothetical protein
MRLRSSWAALCCLMLCPGIARATIVEQLSVERAVALADHVVVGVVQSSEPAVHPRGMILTDTVVLVEQSAHGATLPGDTLVLRLPGGQVGDLVQRVEGVPAFEPGELVLLFLAPTGDRIKFRTVGLFQGVYHLQDTAGGLIAVQHRQHGALVIGAGSADALPKSVGLDTFLSQIRRTLELQ